MVKCSNWHDLVSWFGFQAILVQIIEFLGKILLEDYTLTYIAPECTKALELLCQKISLFY
jgi:hypothetical protein